MKSPNMFRIAIKFLTILMASILALPVAAHTNPTVTLVTDQGDITLEVYLDRAPASASDFLRYVTSGLYDGSAFYRVVRPENDHGDPPISVIQGGVLEQKRFLPPVRHETTQATGLRHVDGAVSLARGEPGTGSAGSFFISIGDQPGLDFGGRRQADGQGFAVFGRVISGMDVVRRIHGLKSDGPADVPYLEGQILAEPVKITAAKLSFGERCDAVTLQGATGTDAGKRAPSTAFERVAVVDTRNGMVRRDRTVVVSGDTIVCDLPSSEASLPPETVRIDGRGLFLAPGLADMHTHLPGREEAALYVIHGVTTVRNMWGTPDTLALREKIRNGEIIGPRIITSGPIIDGVPPQWDGSAGVGTIDAARAEVRRQVEAGYDLIKVYSGLKPEMFSAIVDEAAVVGIPVAGHVPDAVSMDAAISARLQSMEHLLGFDRSTAEPGVDVGARRSQEQIELGNRLRSGELRFEEAFSLSELERLAVGIARNNGAITPTLVAMSRVYLPESEKHERLKAPAIALVRPAFLHSWSPSSDLRLKALSSSDLAGMQAMTAGLQPMFLKVLREAGVRILVGTDAPNPFVVFGLSVHEELRMLVEAGLSPAEAVRAGTVSAAEVLNEAGKWGEIRTDARADLLLLRGNPLENVSYYEEIQGVMVSGIWYDFKQLEDLKNSLVAEFDAMKAP